MESEEEGEVFMDLSNMKETRDLEVSKNCEMCRETVNHQKVNYY